MTQKRQYLLCRGLGQEKATLPQHAGPWSLVRGKEVETGTAEGDMAGVCACVVCAWKAEKPRWPDLAVLPEGLKLFNET